MKTLIILPIALVILIIAFGFTVRNYTQDKNGGIIFFEGTWEEALAKAKSEKKLIFLDAYASWCGPCKMMKRRTFSDPKVGEQFNKYFVNLAIDMEEGQGPELARKFQVNSYPTLIFLQANGTLITKAIGYHSSEEFLNIIKKFSGK